ncbi:MAG: hypothetical protein KAJ51_06685, partial [Thermoplasmata archaeon]|nr:hypothetical protein [Thermoplasmata archaeon]
MRQRNRIMKCLSLFTVLLFVLSSSLLILQTSVIQPASAASSKTDNINSGFDKGTLYNVVIYPAGMQAGIILENDEWTLLKPNTKPATRANHAMASIYNTQNAILFGGYYKGYDGETWVYDISGNSWKKLSPTTQPSSRMGHAMVSIVGNDRCLMFGGYNSAGYESTGWLFDESATDWSKAGKLIIPGRRAYHAMA